MPHDRAIIVRCLTALDILLIKQISKYILHLAATWRSVKRKRRFLAPGRFTGEPKNNKFALLRVAHLICLFVC